MAQSLQQKIAAIEAKLARLRNQSRQLETGQKIILGGMLLNAARHEPRIRQWLIAESHRAITRDIDKKRIAPLIAELESLSAQTTR
jgi:hypothetical protein